MIDTLTPYPAYKESGLPWLGQVPEHWEVTRLSSILSERNETNEKYQVTEVLSVLKDIGVILYSEKGRIGNKKSDDIGRYKIVRPDDIVLNSMNVIIGSVGRSKYVGCLSPVYYVLRLRNPTNLSTYFETVFRNKLFQLSLVRIGNGILSHRMRIPMEKLKAELVPLPPPAEQAAIVRFLDWAGGRLERTIRAKRKIIALLNEQKQALIHRAVTRGLDPDVPLKDSGIPWLGEIPAHWEVRRAKYLFREVAERSIDGTEELLSVSHITGVTPRNQKNITMFKAESYAGHKTCRCGDLVVNTMWAWMGALGVSDYEGIISPAYAVYRPLRPVSFNGSYIDLLLRSNPYIASFTRNSTGVRASRMRLYPEQFFRIPILLPPISEQEDIVVSLVSETKDITTAISRLEREIELLREYRTRLISDVVTGKLDVRVAAASLPAEPGSDSLATDLDALEDDTVDALDATEEDV